MKTDLRKPLFDKIPGAWKLCQKLRDANLNDHKYRVDHLKKRGNKWDFLNICMWIQAVNADRQVPIYQRYFEYYVRF